jgi:integrase
MKQVDGVYTKQDYEKVEGYLQAYYPQMALFWAVGVDTGYRVSDILRLKVSDVIGGRISLIERKTGKQKDAPISNYTLTLALDYVAKNGLKNDCYIFWCGRHKKGVEPVTRQYVWRVIKQAGQMVGLPRLNLAHIRHARHMHGASLLALHRLTQHNRPSITNTSQPRLGMSREEWNNFLRGLMA